MSIADKPLLRREVNARATRAEIIRAGREAFAARGYASVPLDEIARAAHATTGAVYHHFGGKSGLLLAVAESVEQELLDAIRAEAPPNATCWESIYYAVGATLDLCSRPSIARIIFVDAPNVLGLVAWREVEMRYGLGGLHALFRQAAKAGELGPTDPALVARLVMAALIEAVQAIVEDGSGASLEAARDAMNRLIDGFRETPVGQ